ncbi:MBL fold metallo-hydrolase [Telluria sp. Tellsp104]
MKHPIPAAMFAALLLPMTVRLPACAAEVQQKASPAVQVITLGTAGGPRVRLKRSEPSTALRVGDAVYLIDAGDRVLQQLEAARINQAQVRAVFITHYHLDHTAGLMPMLGIRWMRDVSTPLKLIGPPGLKAVTAGFDAAMAPTLAIGNSAGNADPLKNVSMAEVPAGGLVFEDENIRVFAVENTHFHQVAEPSTHPKSYSYRVETSRGTVVFTGDTGPSDAVTRLAQGADMLVSEVINADVILDGARRTKDKMPAAAYERARAHLMEDHLAPEAVGQMASKAGVHQVVLTHIGPGLDTETSEQADALYAAGVRKVFSGQVSVASDLQVFPLTKP